MQLPPDLQWSFVDIGTPVPANTDGGPQNVTALPGAGRRIRVWMISYEANSASHAAHNWMMSWQESVAGINWRMAGAYPVGMRFTFPGGYRLNTNSRLQVIYRASIAGPMFYRAQAWYTIEAVS